MDQRPALIGDLLGRIGIIGFFAYVAWVKLLAVHAAFMGWSATHADFEALRLIANIANLAFLFLIVITTAIRLQPLKSSQGIEPRVTAFAGTFALALLALMPPAIPVSPAIVGTAIVFLLIGFALSAYVLIWLGRSFSIMPEARRLVTSGPYGIVRHPLYSAEEIAVFGTLLLNLSMPAVLLVIVQWLLQLRRMHHEEKVLRAAFPDYGSYAGRTPKFFPNLAVLLGLKQARMENRP